MAGKVAANPGANVQIPAGLSIFFKEDNTTFHKDFGAISGLSSDLSVELFEYSQNRRGSNAITKRIPQSKGYSVSGNMDEMTPDNMRWSSLGGAITTVADSSKTVIESATLIVQDGGVDSDFVTLPEAAKSIERICPSTDINTSIDNETFAADDTQVDLTPISSVNPGDEVVVVYLVDISKAANNAVTFKLGANTVISGSAQIQLRMQGGGIGQAITIPSCEISPNGTASISQDGIQTLPFILTARESNGSFADVVMYDSLS